MFVSAIFLLSERYLEYKNANCNIRTLIGMTVYYVETN